MASPYLHEGEAMHIPAQLMLLNVQVDIYQPRGYTRAPTRTRRRQPRSYRPLSSTNGVHWLIDHMIDVLEHDQLELVQIQQ